MLRSKYLMHNITVHSLFADNEYHLDIKDIDNELRFRSYADNTIQHQMEKSKHTPISVRSSTSIEYPLVTQDHQSGLIVTRGIPLTSLHHTQHQSSAQASTADKSVAQPHRSPTTSLPLLPAHQKVSSSIIPSTIYSSPLPAHTHTLAKSTTTFPLTTNEEELALDFSYRKKSNKNVIEWQNSSSIDSFITDVFNANEFQLLEQPDEKATPINLDLEIPLTKQLINSRQLTHYKQFCSASDTAEQSDKTKSKLEQDQHYLCSSQRRVTSSCCACEITLNEITLLDDNNQELSDDQPFNWCSYLSLVSCRSVAEDYFDHYIFSIEHGFKDGMKLEYLYDKQHDYYWLIEIQLSCKNLLLLRYVGLQDNDDEYDFWCDVYQKELHPIGWCRENKKLMFPPTIVTDRNQSGTNKPPSFDIEKLHEQEMNGESAPAYLFDKDIGLTPCDQLKVGMILEIQGEVRPWTVWFVRIAKNQGGLLKLHYVGLDDNESDFYLFYLEWRLHVIGWMAATNSTDFIYELPVHLLPNEKIDRQKIIQECGRNIWFIPPHIFKPQDVIPKHRFISGMKLEVFEPSNQHVYPGSVGHVHNEYYFDVHIDSAVVQDNDIQQHQFCAYASHPFILPAQWATQHKLALMKTKSSRHPEDYWKLYAEKKSQADEAVDIAPERYFQLPTLSSTTSRIEPGMKLELIYPANSNKIVSSTVVHIADHLIWLRVDSEHGIYSVVPINSMKIFPIGWAKYNHIDFIKPLRYSVNVKVSKQNRYECPKIPRPYLGSVYICTLFINHRCYCGPYFCSSRLARLPSSFGPGPFHIVLKEVLLRLINCSTNASRAIRRLEQSSSSSSAPNMISELLKCKKTKQSFRNVSIIREPQSLLEYLRHVCTQLEMCPNLVHLKKLNESNDLCPEKCKLLTTTFTFNTQSKTVPVNKRTKLRFLKRKQKSLLSNLQQNNSNTKDDSATITLNLKNDIDETSTIASNGDDTMKKVEPIEELPTTTCDRKTRGFRLHIEPRTHTITRVARKKILTAAVSNDQKSNSNEIEIIPKEEPIVPDVTVQNEQKFSSNSSESSTSSSATVVNETDLVSSTLAEKSKNDQQHRQLESPHTISVTTAAIVPCTDDENAQKSFQQTNSDKLETSKYATPRPKTLDLKIVVDNNRSVSRCSSITSCSSSSSFSSSLSTLATNSNNTPIVSPECSSSDNKNPLVQSPTSTNQDQHVTTTTRGGKRGRITRKNDKPQPSKITTATTNSSRGSRGRPRGKGRGRPSLSSRGGSAKRSLTNGHDLNDEGENGFKKFKIEECDSTTIVDNNNKSADNNSSTPTSDDMSTATTSTNIMNQNLLDLNPVQWTVIDVCAFLNECGCSFAIDNIKEQEIDGHALLLLDLPTVQEMLEFKLGPAVKLCHAVDQLKSKVIDTYKK
ncbi:unnamed protein product [Didymodactylos carnosus]|uniref:SAM domain-containing protein n=1 Tax=Didymodactylos carnosus TaxID=1234261 RepID=A0A813SQ90_9BILA|nr:unnamed protein product [Didymodactylos carnosus]CAF0951397.1 unnamed protein product [Didymodactylos carnosus]CAF3584004.1 unnamed protein product [Didymodactylos carnosus]CAF3725505.1 unnamed protein product [Didymodactylos carnosus]